MAAAGHESEGVDMKVSMLHHPADLNDIAFEISVTCARKHFSATIGKSVQQYSDFFEESKKKDSDAAAIVQPFIATINQKMEVVLKKMIDIESLVPDLAEFFGIHASFLSPPEKAGGEADGEDQPEEKYEVLCKKGCVMEPFQVNDPSYRCDKCYRGVFPNSIMFGCRKCNYDICEKCAPPRPKASMDALKARLEAEKKENVDKEAAEKEKLRHRVTFHKSRNDSDSSVESFTSADSIHFTLDGGDLDVAGCVAISMKIDGKPWNGKDGAVSTLRLNPTQAEAKEWRTFPAMAPSSEVIAFFSPLMAGYHDAILKSRWHGTNVTDPVMAAKSFCNALSKVDSVSTITVEFKGVFGKFKCSGTFKFDPSQKPNEPLSARVDALRDFSIGSRPVPEDATTALDKEYEAALQTGIQRGCKFVHGGTIGRTLTRENSDKMTKHPITGIPMEKEVEAYVFALDNDGDYVMILLGMRSTFDGARWTTPIVQRTYAVILTTKETHDKAVKFGH